LTALGQFLLTSGRVKFILHAAASSREPMRTERALSFDAASVLEAAGSRYGPGAPLVDFTALLDRAEPFALIAKPCDIAAVPVLNEMTHLPVILDPSHATGKRSLVPAVARAGVAIGADGMIVEVHPNPEKARQGVQLTNLAVDPETSKVVEQIFAWRVEGVGFRTIATRLTDQGFPCPSAADRERNPHRHGRAWSVGAVRTIVMNPKYKGQGVYGRYRKVERLFDVNDPAAGNVTRMSLAPASEVIETDGIVGSSEMSGVQ